MIELDVSVLAIECNEKKKKKNMTIDSDVRLIQLMLRAGTPNVRPLSVNRLDLGGRLSNHVARAITAPARSSIDRRVNSIESAAHVSSKPIEIVAADLLLSRPFSNATFSHAHGWRHPMLQWDQQQC